MKKYCTLFSVFFSFQAFGMSEQDLSSAADDLLVQYEAACASGDDHEEAMLITIKNALSGKFLKTINGSLLEIFDMLQYNNKDRIIEIMQNHIKPS